ncbi:mitochondrial 37S ribosomal protein mS35 [Dipodascopsis tothii]|uniref:mitochondrial 37S ribosomal protein mS35 n=1 Tax=Dipodascopsis tothii TaxID=44089 RepID=UPI0034CFD569
MFQFDDVTASAHWMIQMHRMKRMYNRVAAYEMPMLRSLSSEYRAPGAEEIFRFRFTTYLGEDHPGERKVTVEFKTKDLRSLSDSQLHKFRLLCGTRYNAQTDVVRMSCESFAEPAQNQRYLRDLIDRLVGEAREGDTFEDVPLDTRHLRLHRKKAGHKFPAEWARPQDAPERVRALAQYRQVSGKIPKTTKAVADMTPEELVRAKTRQMLLLAGWPEENLWLPRKLALPTKLNFN